MADNVNHPHHYSKYQHEPIDVINDWDLPFDLGNVIKYLSRYKDKNDLEDLHKAQFYLNDFIARQELPQEHA